MGETTRGIAGHKGAGTVVAIAEDVKDLWKEGDRVGIKWVASICQRCEFCTNGFDEMLCPHRKTSGTSIPGTFQEYCLTDARYASRLPDGVTDEEAGPIMCGGVTSYVACKRSRVRRGQWIVIPGAEGGLGHLAVQYAKAMGMRVIAIDGGEQKRKLRMDLGAEHFIDYTTSKNVPAEVMEITTYGAHGLIVTAATREGYATAPALLRPRGTLVAMLNVVGTVTGTLKDVDEALDFTARGLVRPVLNHGTLHDLNDILAKMAAGELAGRAVLKIAS